MTASQPPIAARPARQVTDWIGLGDASTLLGVSAATLRRWSDEGRIPVFTTPGGHRRYSRQTLATLVPRRRERPPLAHQAGTTERIARAYRVPSRHRRPAPAAGSWVDGLAEAERAEFRLRGRMLVEELLSHLDDASGDERRHLERATEAAAAHGRAMAERGCSTVEAVETFLRFRAPFLDEMVRIARRRGLDTREITELFARVESALDRLLVATIEGHAGMGVSRDGATPGDGERERTAREGTGRVPL